MDVPLGYISYDSNTFILKMSLTITYSGNLQEFHEFFEKALRKSEIFFLPCDFTVTPTHNNSSYKFSKLNKNQKSMKLFSVFTKENQQVWITHSQ